MEIGNRLNARYVLDGSLRRSASRFRITAQLVDVQGTLCWAIIRGETVKVNSMKYVCLHTKKEQTKQSVKKLNGIVSGVGLLHMCNKSGTRGISLRVLSLVVILCISLPLLTGAQTNSTREAFFRSAGVRIRYIDRGSGEPVVLLHGYTGTIERHFIDSGVIPKLERDYRVIALDLRGHGGSDKPHEPSAYGAEMGQDVIRLLDHLGIRRAHIVGYSLGAHIVGQLLTENLERFTTATLVGSAPWRAWTNEQARRLEAAAVELESDVPFRSLILRLTPTDSPRPSEEEIRSMSASIAARNDVRALAAFQRGFHTLVVSDEQMAAVRVPTVGVVGTDDPNFEAMKELKTVMRNFDLVVVKGATHGGERGILQRQEFFDAVRRIIETNTSRRKTSLHSSMTIVAERVGATVQ